MFGQIRALGFAAIVSVAVVSSFSLAGCQDTTPEKPTQAATPAAEKKLAPAKAEAKKPEPYTLKTRVDVAQKSVMLDVVATDGYHVNKEYPTHFVNAGDKAKVAFKEGTNLTYGKACANEAEHACEMALSLEGEQAQGKLAFSVCDADVCLIKKVDVSTSASEVP